MGLVGCFQKGLCMLDTLDKEKRMNINIIKEEVRKHLNKSVEIAVHGMRNKSYIVKGTITHVYPSIFIVNEEQVEKSFSYSDLATGEINIKYL